VLKTIIIITGHHINNFTTLLNNYLLQHLKKIALPCNLKKKLTFQTDINFLKNSKFSKNNNLMVAQLENLIQYLYCQIWNLTLVYGGLYLRVHGYI
jgi:hypothetical protein